MNGQQQQERKTAIIQLQEDLKKGLERVETAALDAFKVELESRLAQGEELKSLFAKMVDDETTFRKAAIVTAIREARLEWLKELNNTNHAVLTFIKLPWWKRWFWCLIGAKALLWFPVPGLSGRTVWMKDAVAHGVTESATVSHQRQPYTSEKP